MKTKTKRKKNRRLMLVIAVAMLLLTAFGGIACHRATGNLCREAETMLKWTIDYAEAGDFLGAEKQVSELNTFWEQKTLYLGLFYEHEAANRISEGIARLSVYARTRGRPVSCIGTAASSEIKIVITNSLGSSSPTCLFPSTRITTITTI